MVERIKSRKGVGQKPKYMLFLEALNRIYRTLQSDSVTVIKIVINADYLGFFLISYNFEYIKSRVIERCGEVDTVECLLATNNL